MPKTPKATREKPVVRIWDHTGAEIYKGTVRGAEKILRRRRKPGEVLRCDVRYERG